MSLGFPSNPNPGDTYVLGSRTYVWNGVAWAIQSSTQVVTQVTATVVTVTTSTQSTSTNTGALVVNGGIGTGGAVNAGTTSTVSGAEIITTATVAEFAVTALYAGTDTAVSGQIGQVTVWNTSTLQSVTDRGNTTTNSIHITNLTSATSVGTGAFVVDGGGSFGGNLYLGGTLFSGGVPVLTTSSFVNSISAGEDIYIVDLGLNVLQFNDISTLQTVTHRGNTTTNQVLFLNTTNSTSSSTGAVVISGGLGVEQDVWVGGDLYATNIQIADTIFDSTQISINTTATVVVDMYPVSMFRSSKYLIQIDDGTGPSANFEVIEILLLVDNAGTVYATEYAVLTSSGELEDFAADVQGDNMVRLYFTPYQASSKTIKTLRTAMTV